MSTQAQNLGSLEETKTAKPDEKETAGNKCCCSWYICKDFVDTIEGSDHEDIKWWKGSLIRVKPSQTAKNRKFIESVEASLNPMPRGQSELCIARHHFPPKLFEYHHTKCEKPTMEEPLSEVDYRSIYGKENLHEEFVEEQKSGRLYCKSPIVKIATVSAIVSRIKNERLQKHNTTLLVLPARKKAKPDKTRLKPALKASQLNILAGAVSADGNSQKSIRAVLAEECSKQSKKTRKTRASTGKLPLSRAAKKQKIVPKKVVEPDLVLSVTKIHDFIRYRCSDEVVPLSQVLGDPKVKECFRLLREYHKSFDPVVCCAEEDKLQKAFYLNPCRMLDPSKCLLFKILAVQKGADVNVICEQCHKQKLKLAKVERRFQKDGETLEKAIERRTAPDSSQTNMTLTPDEMRIKLERLSRERSWAQRNNRNLTDRVKELERTNALHVELELLLETKLEEAREALDSWEKLGW